MNAWRISLPGGRKGADRSTRPFRGSGLLRVIRSGLLVTCKFLPPTRRAAPAGSPCRTGKGRVAVRYHTARAAKPTTV
ncbi:zinc finger domain-containing protein [Micromonospora sp. DT201]|uniref:zinc finger domain-containing protein n=1 Tax=Micromonospora sp. DT201 TaxID=3393442 RepID=UPI003CEFA326